MTESIGQQLRQAREARSLTLEDAAGATHIRVYYLKAFEAGKFEILPSLVQGKGFLRAYAGFLGMDPQPLIAELENEIGQSGAANGTPAEAGSPGPASRSMAAPASRSMAAPVSRPLSAPANKPNGPQPDTRQAQAIFIEIGQKLRHQRELLGLSLEDVERHTHLRTHFLTTLEAGALEGLPSPVQGRGMLHNYAIFLGLNPEPLMLRFAEGLQALLAARQAVEKKTTQPRKPSRLAERAARPALQADVGSREAVGSVPLPADFPANAEAEASTNAPAYAPANAPATPRHLTLRRFFTPDMLLGAVIVIFLAAFMVWGGLHILNLGSATVSQTPTSTAPSIADVLSTNSVDSPTAPASAISETISGTLLAPVQTLSLPTLAPIQALTTTVDLSTAAAGATITPRAGPIQINLVIRQRAWMRVLVDGKVEFDGIALPGSAYPFSGDKSIEVLTGNGEALQVVFNQSDLGVLGSYGEVVDQIYSLKGVLTPTASITPTLQRSPTPLPGSETPAATPTAKPTTTPTPKPTTRPPGTPTP